MLRPPLFLLLPPVALAQIVSGQPQMQRLMGPQLPQPAGKGVIEGTVVDSVTHEPLKKAQITLAGPLQSNPGAVTDAGGRFSFRDLPAGRYWLNASKPGYNPPQNALGGFTANGQIALSADEEKKGVEVALMPGGSIRGRIVDEDGAPLRGCSVTAARPGYEQGRRMLQHGGGSNTNGKGEYTISSLTSGRYYVFARCQAELPAPHPLLPRGDPRTPLETLIPKFYGGGLDPSTATRLSVGPGTSLEGIDFEMHRIPVSTLRGIVTLPGPDAADNISVSLMPVNRQLRNLLQFGGGVDPDHTFQIHVIPGSYLLVAFSPREGHPLYAQRTVEIGTTPPDPVEIALSGGAEMKGTVQYDSGDHPPFENAQIFLHPSETNFYSPQAHGEINKDGSFTLEGVLPGRWRVMVGALGYVKSLDLGGQQVSPYDFVIPPGATGPLRVVMGSKMGDIKVTVEGGTQERQGTVLLYPEDTTRLGSGLERASVGVNEVDMGSVPPGRYRVLATDSMDPWPILQRPDLLKALEGSTAAVDVPEGGKVSATVELLSREELARLVQDKD